MAAVAKTKDDILNIIKEKKDKDRMKVLMESAGNVATWNADQFLKWPKVNNKGNGYPRALTEVVSKAQAR